MKKSIKIITAFLLAALLASVLGLSALALKSDYSKPGAQTLTELSAPGVLKEIFNIDLLPVEEEYLSLYGDYELVYGSNIPASYATVANDTAAKKISVIAKEYSYVATNGVKVLWLPVSAKFDDVTAEFTKNTLGYVAEFDFEGEDPEASVLITYSTELTVSAAVLNELLNKAYNDALSWKSYIANAEAEYESALQKYNEASESYAQYLVALDEYNTAKALYSAYLKDKRIYDERLKAYNDYLSELAEYEAELEIYEVYEAALAKYNSDYALYQQYLTDKANYDKNLAAYNLYVENHAKVVSQLAIIDGTKKYSTSLNRSVYDAILGETVSKVIDNKDAIANSATGIDGAIIDKAGLATENLRALYATYFSLSGEAQRYTYYALNYESWRDNFVNLFKVLDKLYKYPEVRFALGEYGIQTKFEILLAQLYYVANALSDTPIKNYDGTATYDSNYKINPLTEIKPLARLENVEYMADTNAATPLKDGYPTAVKKPTLTEVAEPTRPTQVMRPTAPDPVGDPGDPPTELIKPTEPDIVSPPGKEPTPYVPDGVISALIAAYDANELSLRAQVTASKKLRADITLNKKIFNSEICTVLFRDTDGTLLESVEVEKGTYAEYSGALPEKAADAAATYTFCGWQDADGNIQSLDAVEHSLELYPAFTPTYKSYKITWIVGESVTVSDALYGTLPEYDGTPFLPDSENKEYVFKGWNKEIAEVTADTTYVAEFDVRYVLALSDGTGAAFSYNEDGDLCVDLGKSYDTELKVSLLLSKLAERGSLTVKSRLYTLYFSFSDVISMHEAEVCTIRVENVKSGNGNKFSVTLLDDQGDLVPLTATLTVKCSVEDEGAFSVYTLSDGERISARYKLEDGNITLVCNSGNTYYTATEYSVNLLPSDRVTLSADKLSCPVGETVKISVLCPVGAVIDGVYVIDASGEKIYLSGDSFVMSAGGVSVGVEFHYLTYTVSFVSDGKVISTATCYYGELPIEPPAPEKVTDGKYTYEFIGWSTVVSEVTEDVTYTAIYKATPVPEKENNGELQISDGVLKIIVAAAVAVGYFALVILPVTVITVVKTVRNKRRKKPKKEQ